MHRRLNSFGQYSSISTITLLSALIIFFLIFGCNGGGGSGTGNGDDDGNSVIFYEDYDGDNYGNPNSSIEATSQPTGYVLDNTDCDDSNQNINPAATEICGDNVDQDCNGLDLDCPLTTYYFDSDGDGYGDPDNFVNLTSQPIGYVLN